MIPPPDYTTLNTHGLARVSRNFSPPWGARCRFGVAAQNASKGQMKTLTSAEKGATDRRTENEFGVPLSTLMENAGGAVARFCLRRYPETKRVTVLCGKGNNRSEERRV